MDEGFQMTSFSSCAVSKPYVASGPMDFECGTDLSSSIIFSTDFQRFDDLKNLLESNKDAMKLDAMKRIIGMTARGKDCAELFPSVVKNVVSKNAEIRKLVYLYLTRYAEEHQDVALLSVSTFQRLLKDPNQLVRASALRVFSSIRVPLLIPVIMLAVQAASKDASAYVRRAAAHGILKIYSLGSEEKESLVPVISLLLSDKSTLVIGTAVYAFEQVCPERLDLIHHNYKKLCNMLMDLDEWGQIVVINMLLRYVRTQFPDPRHSLQTLIDQSTDDNVKPGDQNKSTSDRTLISGENDGLDDNITYPESWLDGDYDAVTVQGGGDTGTKVMTDCDGSQVSAYSVADALPLLKADFYNLLSTCRYLLHSRNVGVVIAVCRLIFELFRKEDFPAVVKALVRSMQNSPEVQYIVLRTIVTLAREHHALFEPYLRSFFVYTSDSNPVKLLKLEVLCNLATEATSPSILREFQHYISSSDSEFAKATIQAIGHCASAIPQIANICLTGLVRLMSRPDEKVVAECVVVLRKLLQMHPCNHKEIIKHIAQLTDTMKVPSALASILWLLGEYSHRVPRIAPDVLRKLVKVFPSQEAIVKLQILNLAAKLCIVNPRQVTLLTQYVFSLARYDQDYDVRDRSRLLHGLIFPQSTAPDHGIENGLSCDASVETPVKQLYLAKHAKAILLASKPAPVLHSLSTGHKSQSGYLQWGSMSHILHRRLPDYHDLPTWPKIPPNPWSRQVKVTPNSGTAPFFGTPNVSSGHWFTSPTVVDRTSASTGHQHKALSDFFSDLEDEIDCEDNQQPTCDGEGLDSNVDGEDKISTDTSCDETTPEDSDFDLFDQLYPELCSKKVDSGFPDIPVGADASPLSSGTTEPSDSDEDTFASDRIALSRLGEAGDGAERLEFPSKPAFVPVETKQVIPVDSLGSAIRNPTSPDARLSPPPPDEAANTDSECGNTSVVSGTSSVSLPTLACHVPPEDSLTIECNSASTDNSISPTPSVTLAPSLDLESLHNSPTPLPTLEPLQSVNSLPMGYLQSILTMPYPLHPICQSDTESLPWYHSVSPSPTSNWLHLRYQFLRTFEVERPRFIILRLLFDLDLQSSVILVKDLRMDLKNTALGRLLLDANRIEPFEPVATLTPGNQVLVTVGIDFAGFTDPIELDFVYSLEPDELLEVGSASSIRWPVVIAPPAGELIRPHQLDLVNYIRNRDQYVNDQEFDQLDPAPGTFETTLLADPAKLTDLLLQHCNMTFLFAYWLSDPCLPFNLKEPSERANGDQPTGTAVGDDVGDRHRRLSLFFSSHTVADDHLCLLEVSWQQMPDASAAESSIVPCLSLIVFCQIACFRKLLINHLLRLLDIK